MDAFVKDPWHHLSCSAFKSKNAIARHDHVVHALYLTARDAAARCIKEPTISPKMKDESRKRESRRESRGSSNGKEFRADLEITATNDKRYLIDVKITHPLCQSHISAAASYSLGAADKAEQQKNKKYEKAIKVNDYEFIPFVIETTGGISSAAEKFLEELFIWIYKYQGQEGKRIVKDLKDSIAIAVQRGNAVLIRSHMRSVIRSNKCWMYCESA